MLELATYSPIRDGLEPVHQAALSQGNNQVVLNSLFQYPAEFASTNALMRLIADLEKANAITRNTNAAQTDGQRLANNYLVDVEALGQYLQTQRTEELAGARR